MKSLFCLILMISISAIACKKDHLEDVDLVSDDTTFVSSGKSFYVDINSGNDLTGKGSQSSPFRTINKALDSLQSGDILLVNNGNYGDVILGRTPGLDWGEPSEITVPYSKFKGWVLIKAAPGQTPHFNTLQIGTLNIPNSGSPSKSIDFSQKGNCDVYMSIEGITIDDGAFIAGSRYVKIRNCTINRKGELNGSVDNLDNRTGLEVVNGRYITIENNNITHVAIGIAAASYDIVIKNNEIHHNSHDGIRILGGSGFLVEGNRIHDLDDGYDDNVDWARHTDGIHLFDLFDVTTKLTISRNLFYHIECMGMMIQGGEGSVKNSDWVIENNIFGPIGSIVIHFGTDVHNSCIIRHNTVVMAPNDTWKSMYNRTMTSKAYHVALWSVDAVNKGYKVYNNIFTDDTTVPSEYGFASNNTFYNASNMPIEAIPGNIADYIASGKIPGTLKAGSPAINSGATSVADTKIDFTGKLRDQKPDIGALEK